MPGDAPVPARATAAPVGTQGTAGAGASGFAVTSCARFRGPGAKGRHPARYPQGGRHRRGDRGCSRGTPGADQAVQRLALRFAGFLLCGVAWAHLDDQTPVQQPGAPGRVSHPVDWRWPGTSGGSGPSRDPGAAGGLWRCCATSVPAHGRSPGELRAPVGGLPFLALSVPAERVRAAEDALLGWRLSVEDWWEAEARP